MGKGKGSTDEYPFMQTPDLLSHFLHLGYTNSTLSPIWAPTVRRTPPLTQSQEQRVASSTVAAWVGILTTTPCNYICCIQKQTNKEDQTKDE